MKFGKNLCRVVDTADPEWAPFWINYKYLKTSLKEMHIQHNEKNSDKKENLIPDKMCSLQKKSMAKVDTRAMEVQFFGLVRAQLRKCAEFYKSAEQQLRVRRDRIKDGLVLLEAPDIIHDGNPAGRLMAACVNFYKDLLMLENYAIMNYCGFSKILKKHDKITGYNTRNIFMKTIVNQQSFTHYKEVIEMLQEIESIFKRVKMVQKPGESSSDINCMKTLDGKILASASEEQQRQIESYRDIHTDAIRIQQVESEGMSQNSDHLMMDAADSLQQLASQRCNEEQAEGKRKCGASVLVKEEITKKARFSS